MIGAAAFGADAITHGVVLGLVYGVLAVGLVLVFRASGVVNFAHGETGALGAAVLAKLVLDEHWPFVIALPAVLLLGGVIGGTTQLLVARRLVGRPRLVLLVATIGLAQLLVVAQLLLPHIREVAPYPSMLHRELTVGPVALTGRDFVPIAVIPAIVVALVVWLARTPSGRALRAVGDNPDAAELAGIRPGRVALIAWSVAGVVATATAVLANPLQGVIIGRPTQAFGAGLMVRALAAGLVGGLRSLPWAMAGGVAVGLIQAVADTGRVDPAVADVILLVFILGVTLVRSDERDRIGGSGELAVVPPVTNDRRRWVALIVAVGVAACLPLVAGRSSQLFSFSRIVLYAVVGLSLVLLTGWTGQLSLGQFAVVGVGTFGAAFLERHGVSFWLTIPIAVAIGMAVSLVIGLPALRVRGLELAVTTLAFAVACSSWVFTRGALLGAGGAAGVTRERVLRGPVVFYEFCLGALVAALLVVAAIRRGHLGRRLLAVRANERRAASLGVSPIATKLIGFALAGAFAALAGVLLGALRVRSSPSDFGPEESLRIVAITVIGGAGSTLGAVIGAVVVLGVPAIFGDTTVAGLLPSGIGLLLLALLFPGGLADLARRIRGAAGRPGLGARWSSAPSLADRASPKVAAPVLSTQRLQGVRPARLAVSGLTVKFGGRLALDAVDLEVEPGSVVGLIGANGAGKSTLLDAVSGFVRPYAGSILLDGRPIDRLSPAARARLGVGRVLQDARLFDDLTVGEAVMLAGGSSGDRAVADSLDRLGIADLAQVPCQELPTGSRRLAELACALVRRPSLLLLDEPTAGLAREEVDRYTPLLLGLRAELGATVVLVEHDVELVTVVSDRLVCLGAGMVLADGPATHVFAQPAVLLEFLGG